MTALASGTASSTSSATSTPVRVATRRRLRRKSSSSDDSDAGIARQLLRESRQAASRAATTTGATGPRAGSKTALRIRRRHLLTWDELAHASYSTCFYSWTYLHNESGESPVKPIVHKNQNNQPDGSPVNILSHAFGTVAFVGLAVTLWLDTWPWTLPSLQTRDVMPNSGNSTADKLAATAYMLGVIVCFSLSALFHTLMCHSADCAARGMAMDITGVLVLMAGAVIPLIHFGLACEHAYVRQAFYVATAVLGTLAAATTWEEGPGPCTSSAPRTSATDNGLYRMLIYPIRSMLHWVSVQGPANGHRRAALFLGFVTVSCAGPLVWMRQADPADWAARIDLWPGVIGTLLCNAVGFVAYTTHFPERRWPRHFDLVGASHQLMHLAVLAAAVTHIGGVNRALAFRRGEGAVCRNGWAS
ncbi:hypothetical protein SPBR_02742 [Sporothrix brasiliensis 5110]|uniref:Uncharacterized protein n=1 Tax=Sporothrix brasiliensis 5110 TaxID=1398154 RepID=A0A0C2J1D4_9PEZI|nr:uncharacterized protein SPBR_02742 [Sporothrix brasiliensis 5110]KIH92830.1 hypothetical protein SPBR_02742 [Sporothrix brasiliensis 5110]